MSREPEQPEFASTEEICNAIESLREPEDYARLRKAATYCLYGTEFTDPKELLGEAVLRTLSAADGGKGRRWPKGVDFMSFLIMSMQSIADGSRASAVQTRTSYLEVMGVEIGVDAALAHAGHAHQDVVQDAIHAEEDLERWARSKSDVALIEAFFVNDQEVSALIMGEKAEMKAEEIREIFEIDKTTYDTARRRFRRGLDKLMPGRRKA